MKKSKLSIGLLFISALFGGEISITDSALNDYLKQDLKYSEENINNINKVEKYQVLNPINVSAAKSDISTETISGSTDTEEEYYQILFNQDIWRSGGIYYAIKYSEGNKNINELDLEERKKILVLTIKNQVKILQILELNIELVGLTIKNNEISYKLELEDYEAGLKDNRELNSLLIENNSLKNTLIDLKREKIKTENKLKEFTEYKYQQFKRENLVFPSKYYYMKNSKLKIEDRKVQLSKTMEKVNRAKYLPKLSLSGSYKQNINESELLNKRIGLTLSMNIHPNMKYETQMNKINSLKIKNMYNKLKYDLDSEYEQKKLEYSLLEEKINNLKESNLRFKDLEVYAIENYENGMGKISSVNQVRNNILINEKNIEIVNYEKDLIVIELLLK